MKFSFSVLLAAIAHYLPASESFVTYRTTTAPFVTTRTRHSSVFDDFEEFSSDQNNDSSGSDDTDLFAALRARQASISSNSNSKLPSSLQQAQQQLQQDEDDSHLTNWKEAVCVSTVRLSLGDWIRRMAIDTYPLAVCGSAGGNLYLADLQRGEELDCLMQLHAPQAVDGGDASSPANIEEALTCLYGKMDGGGVIAIAIKDDLIVSAGREGGVHVSTISGQEEEFYKGSRGGTSRQTKLTLERKGKIRGLEEEMGGDSSGVLITSLAFDGTGTLWAGGFDGILRGYDYEEQGADGRPLMVRQKHPLHEIKCGSGIVSLSVNDDIGCGVASTVEDGLILFSLEDGEIIGRWNPFVKKVRKEFVRSAIIVQNDKASSSFGTDDAWSVVCGGSRGTMFQRRLNVDRTGYVSESHPFLDQTKQGSGLLPVKMRPSHLGTVVNLASPAPGLFVSGAQDGSMRVWDCSTSESASEDDTEDDDDDDDDEEAQYDDIQPNDSRPQCLYALSGYKVWLGSIFANGKKLVSDGADNTIIVHSFDEDEEDVLFREDDEDDMEGFSFE